MDHFQKARWMRIGGLALLGIACAIGLVAAMLQSHAASVLMLAMATGIAAGAAYVNIRALRERTIAKHEKHHDGSSGVRDSNHSVHVISP